MNRADVQAWLDAYVSAWLSYDEEQIGGLFAETAEYRYHPSDDPVVGREAIVRSWIGADGDAGTRDEPGTYEARYEPWAVDGAKAVAVGWSRYWTDASRSAVRVVYDNCFLLEFDDGGRCRSFAEFYRERPGG